MKQHTRADDIPGSGEADVAVSCITPGEARALRCSLTVSATEGTGPINLAAAKALTALDSLESGQAPQTAKGELILQLSLKSTQELLPPSEGQTAPATVEAKTDEQIPESLESQIPLSSEGVAAIKSLAAEEAEEVSKSTAVPELQPEAAQQTSPNVAAQQTSLARDAYSHLPASPTLHGTTTAASEHSSPRSIPTPDAERLAPTLPELPTRPALQRMDVILHGTDQVVRLDIRQNHGSVKVAIHSDDAALAARLRESLPELLNRLDDRGLKARVTSLGSQSTALPVALTESGNSPEDTGKWSRDMARPHQQKERNPQRAWRAATWKLHEE
jgi:hypothetical protein